MPVTITSAQRCAAPSTDEAIAWLTDQLPFDGSLSQRSDAHRGTAELVRGRAPPARTEHAPRAALATA
jgi:hypothetical protein